MALVGIGKLGEVECSVKDLLKESRLEALWMFENSVDPEVVSTL